MYDKFYKLTSRPFRLSPDPRFFFSSSGHKRALAYLRYGIKQGEGFIIVTGNVGTGKSTLVSMLFQMLAKENVIGAQVVTTQMDADNLLRMVAAEFGLPYARVAKAPLLKSIEEYCRACVQEGKRVLLVVDEAQGLPPKAIEELRMLSNFQMNGRSLIQSFLLGQREFRQTMRSKGFEQLRQRVIAAYHLKPLDEAETREYVRHRLVTAGWKDDPTIDDAIFPEIFQFTGGVPRRINTLCDRLLLFGYLEGLHHLGGEALGAVTADIIEEHGGGDDDPIAVSPEGAPQLTSAGAETDTGGGRRLEKVEESVASLTEVLRQEMSQLRKALIEKQSRDPGEDDAG